MIFVDEIYFARSRNLHDLDDLLWAVTQERSAPYRNLDKVLLGDFSQLEPIGGVFG